MSRYAYVEIIPDRKPETVADAFERFITHIDALIHTVLTDNGFEFTDRFMKRGNTRPVGTPSGMHPFDLICKRHNIKHKLTRVYRPQTNGMVERFNRR